MSDDEERRQMRLGLGLLVLVPVPKMHPMIPLKQHNTSLVQYNLQEVDYVLIYSLHLHPRAFMPRNEVDIDPLVDVLVQLPEFPRVVQGVGVGHIRADAPLLVAFLRVVVACTVLVRCAEELIERVINCWVAPELRWEVVVTAFQAEKSHEPMLTKLAPQSVGPQVVNMLLRRWLPARPEDMDLVMYRVNPGRVVHLEFERAVVLPLVEGV
jgi:hypothetical protein